MIIKTKNLNMSDIYCASFGVLAEQLAYIQNEVQYLLDEYDLPSKEAWDAGVKEIILVGDESKHFNSVMNLLIEMKISAEVKIHENE